MSTQSRIGRQPIISERVRCIGGEGFAFVPNRLLRDGFFASLAADELRLYIFLVLAGDRNGLSFYHYDSICSLLAISVERYIEARNNLIRKYLVAFDGSRFQVLSLPAKPHRLEKRPLETEEDMKEADPATIRIGLQRWLRSDEGLEP